MAECPSSNIAIMQLFHELKQKFPAVPDRVVTECIRLNIHNKEACEEILSRENQTFSSPGERVYKMAAEGNYEPCRPNSLQLEDAVWDFDRRLMGRQSLDSLQCSRTRSCKQYSEQFLNNTRQHRSDENLNAEAESQSPRARVLASESPISRLSICDECWSGECSDECRTRVSVLSAPVTPSLGPLTVDVHHCTRVNIEPAPHYQPPKEPPRPFTSVNLTLRPPSTDPQPPIDISSGAGGLTYSSCSYDPRQGYQSRLQISIGPGGQGTVSAARTLAPCPSLRLASSMPDVATTSSQILEPVIQHLPRATKVLVREQLERKERLSRELSKHKERLHSMQVEVRSMAADLQARLNTPNSSIKVKLLREQISKLQTECDRMAQEVYRNAEIRHVNTETLPLGETNEEFYQNIYRGQLFPRQALRHRASAVGEGNWTCHVCTFHNHPALNKCEQCDMPRIVTGSLPTNSLPNPPLVA